MAEDSLIAIGIAVISIVISIVGLILSIQKAKPEKMTHESQLMLNVYDRLYVVERKVDSLKTEVDCLNLAQEYLNALLPLCFFDKKNYLEKDVTLLFESHLAIGLAYHQWTIDCGHITKEQAQKDDASLLRCCKRYSIKKSDSLDPIFEKFRKESNNKTKID